MIRPDAGPPEGVLLAVKVVPGARRSEIVGVMDLPEGPRLRVRISAQPEDGRANRALCEFLAERLGLPLRDVTVAAGLTKPEKLVRLTGVDGAQVLALLS
jgi:uncharacterized protein (TIGR00251 family)